MQGIDISKWQGNIDFSKVKKAGVEFAILRAGYGSSITQKDTKFETYYEGCKTAGIPVGAYWYSYAKSVAQARAEANICLQIIKGKQFEYPIYFDIEDNSQKSLGKTLLTQMCTAFCDTLEKAGYFAGVYANTDWFTNYLNHAELSQKYTIWLADYRTTYNKTLKRDMHQYSSTGKINGISGNVDLDTCTVDFPSIIQSAGLNGFVKSTEKKLYHVKFENVSAGDMNSLKTLGSQLKLTAKITEA